MIVAGNIVAAARHRASAIVIVAVGCVVIAIAPIDTAFTYLTNGSALVRVCLFTVIACVGVSVTKGAVFN
jgi:hypothetical protein